MFTSQTNGIRKNGNDRFTPADDAIYASMSYAPASRRPLSITVPARFAIITKYFSVISCA